MNIPFMFIFLIGFYLYHNWQRVLDKDYLHMTEYLDAIQSTCLVVYEFVTYSITGQGIDWVTQATNLYMLSLIAIGFVHYWGKHVRREET